MKTLLSFYRWVKSLKNETTIIILAVLAFALMPIALRWFDPTAATFDVGLLTAPALGIVGVIGSVILFWVLWRFCFNDKIDAWFDSQDGFLADFFAAPPAVRLACFFGTLWVVVLGVAAITMALR
jgi:hypothetical protein